MRRVAWLLVLMACAPDLDGDGYHGSDCDDGDGDVHPDALELCNGVDDDCDGEIDAEAFDADPWFVDGDGDGFGGTSRVDACAAPAGYVAVGGDCDDAKAAVSPVGTEACNGLDDDCDGAIDPPTAVGARVFFGDADGDGSGTSARLTQACAAPEGYADDGDDCDDADPNRWPGAPEVCGDGIENDCDTDGVFDCDAAECAGDPSCGAWVDRVDDPRGPAGLVTSVAVYGGGFDTGTSGVPTVSFGAAGPCTDVEVLTDGLLLCDTPRGAPGAVDVSVTTTSGTATKAGAFTFTDTVFVADGKGGTAGSLYDVDLGTGDIHAIGNLGVGITGLAFAPDGTLYGVTSGKRRGAASLVTIDHRTAAVKVIGSLSDAGGRGYGGVPDLTFVGSRLVGWCEYERAVEIDTKTAKVTVLGTGTVANGGGALAYDPAAGSIWFAPGATIYRIDPTSGGVTSTGIAIDPPKGLGLNSATLHDGVVYAIDAERVGGYAGIVRVGSDGAMTTIVALSDYVDAIASPAP